MGESNQGGEGCIQTELNQEGEEGGENCVINFFGIYSFCIISVAFLEIPVVGRNG